MFDVALIIMWQSIVVIKVGELRSKENARCTISIR